MSRHNMEDELQKGLELIHDAYSHKATILQTEVSHLKQQGQSKDAIILNLQQTIQALRSSIDERDRDIDLLLRDSQELTHEKAELMNGARTQQQEIGKLSSLKRAILRSVDEEGGSLLLSAMDSSGLGLSGNFTSPHKSGSGAGLSEDISRLSISNPSRIGGVTSSGDYSRSNLAKSGRSGLGDSVLQNSKTGDSRRDVRFADLSQSGPSFSNSSSSVNNTNSSSHPYIEGKEFFKRAKNRLSFDDFNLFLGCIRKLNNQEISKEDAVLSVKDIFGVENSDLHEQFKNLLLKHDDGF